LILFNAVSITLSGQSEHILEIIVLYQIFYHNNVSNFEVYKYKIDVLNIKKLLFIFLQYSHIYKYLNILLYVQIVAVRIYP
jgi:hypothetical protein